MAWSDNVRCLHCDAKLPLYRKITSGQFCSAVHRKAYWQDQERLAVERLHQTHDSLRAYRSPEALEAILGKPAASEPTISVDKYYLSGQPPDVESQPTEEEFARSAANTGQVRFAGFLVEEKPALRAWEALLAAWDSEFAQWPMSAASLPSSAAERREHALNSAHRVATPLFQTVGLAGQIRAAAQQTASIAFGEQPIVKGPFKIAPATEELSQAFLDSLKALEIAAGVAVEIAPTIEESPYPFADRMAPLPKFSPQAVALALRGSDPEPQQTIWKSQNLRCDAGFTSPVVATVASMEPLALTNAPRAMAAKAGAAGDAQIGDLQGYAQPIEPKTASGAPAMNFALMAAAPEMRFASGSGHLVLDGRGAAPQKLNAASQTVQALEPRSDTASPIQQLVSQSLGLNLRAAPGCRYNVQSQPGPFQQPGTAQRSGAANEIALVPAPTKQLATQSLELGLGIAGPCDFTVQSAAGTILPASSAEALTASGDLRIVGLPDGLGRNTPHPAMVGVRPLAFAATPCAPPAPRPETGGIAQIYAANTPLNPVTKWEPLDGSATPQRHGFLAWTQTFGGQDGKHAWTHAVDFWQHAPRDLKLLAIAIPILLGLTLRPSLPKVRVAAPPSTGNISQNLGDGFRAQFVNVRNSVAQRAAVALNEDFRSGLDGWQTRGDLSTGWSFDQNGFVKPGTLALYRPSLGLRDYDFQFLGLIDKKALSWVVRAKDFDNYYVVKLMVTKAGPLPTLGITRYAVIDGKAQESVNTVVPINARHDMLYQVTMNVHDDTFLLSLQDTVVDNWTEPRLKTGGVGFFAARGEESRLRWLQVTHQYDMLGRLCAYLAPYNIPTTNGSW